MTTRPCPDFETMLLDGAAGALDAAAAARLESHLAGCEACRAEAAALESALGAARLPAPSEVEQRALARAQTATLRHWRGAEGSRRNRSLMQGFAAGFAVAAAAAVVVVAPGAYHRAQERRAAVTAGNAVPGNVPGMPGNVPGNGESVPGNGDSAVAAADSAIGWTPELDAAWETSTLAMGDELDTAWTDAAYLTDLDDR